MMIRPTDLFELVFQIGDKIETILRELFQFFTLKVDGKELCDNILVASTTGSKLIGEELDFNLTGMIINNCSIWLRSKKKYLYIIEINFIFRNIQENQKQYFDSLKDFAANFAKQHSITHFCCGLEPIDDEDNQCFSEKGYGNLYNELFIRK